MERNRLVSMCSGCMCLLHKMFVLHCKGPRNTYNNVGGKVLTVDQDGVHDSLGQVNRLDPEGGVQVLEKSLVGG